MKRALVLIVISLLALTAFAAEHEVLVSPAGILYTLESQPAPDDPQLRRHLVLTIRDGDNVTQTVVPESLTSGIRYTPSMAFDAENGALFVFWLRMPHLMASELLLASYRDGKWSTPISVDTQNFRLRSNLRIAITRRVTTETVNGGTSELPALVVHAAWWEQTGSGEQARYALIAMDRGSVSNIEVHALNDFAPVVSTSPVESDLNVEILRHPTFLETGSASSIDVLFGDLKSKSFNRSTLKPIIAHGRIHIPIGRGGGRNIGAPRAMSAVWGGGTNASAANGKLMLYARAEDAVTYVVYANGAWSTVRTVPLGQTLTLDAAISALGRMLTAHE